MNELKYFEKEPYRLKDDISTITILFSNHKY